MSKPDGPWTSEPDSKEWEAHGFRCVLRRGPGNHWCGYVGIPNGHPAFDMPYRDDLFCGVDVHGGLTFGSLHPRHLPDDGLYWVGFDCAHYGDLSPDYAKYFSSLADGEYRDINYAIAETERLAQQLAAMTEGAAG